LKKGRNILVVLLAVLLITISVRESAPLLGYIFSRQSYLYQCQIINHHKPDCQGRCVLVHQLALQEQKNNPQPCSFVPIQVKSVDLFFAQSTVGNSIYTTVIQQFSWLPPSYPVSFPEITTPPPKVL
jgi:hypothetical protein